MSVSSAYSIIYFHWNIQSYQYSSDWVCNALPFIALITYHFYFSYHVTLPSLSYHCHLYFCLYSSQRFEAWECSSWSERECSLDWFRPLKRRCQRPLNWSHFLLRNTRIYWYAFFFPSLFYFIVLYFALCVCVCVCVLHRVVLSCVGLCSVVLFVPSFTVLCYDVMYSCVQMCSKSEWNVLSIKWYTKWLQIRHLLYFLSLLPPHLSTHSYLRSHSLPLPHTDIWTHYITTNKSNI